MIKVDDIQIDMRDLILFFWKHPEEIAGRYDPTVATMEEAAMLQRFHRYADELLSLGMDPHVLDAPLDTWGELVRVWKEDRPGDWFGVEMMAQWAF